MSRDADGAVIRQRSPIGGPLWKAVVGQLEQDIVSGRLEPGERLRENDLARRFGVSRGPIREAIAELARIDLVSIDADRLTTVKTLTAKDVSEIWEMRYCMESHALQHLDRIDDRTIERMRTMIGVMERQWSEPGLSAVFDADMEFHREICKLSSNDRLVESWDRLVPPSRLAVAMVHRHLPGQIHTVLTEHEALLDAMGTREVPRALDLLRQHFLSARDTVLHLLEPSAEARRHRPPGRLARGTLS